MVKLALRDDDTNYFTSPSDLENVYSDFEKFPITFAVVPNVTDVAGGCPETFGNKSPMDVGLNHSLIEYLNTKIKEGTADIALHGLTHEYKVVDNEKVPEMVWRSNDNDLQLKIAESRNRLSELFDLNVQCFVAPSNKITKYCLECVSDAGLNYSGIIPLRYNETVSLRNIKNYLFRWAFRLGYNLPYPGVLQYDNHKEINACILQSYDYLIKMYGICDRHNWPMVINVHYWYLRDNPKAKEILRSFVMDYAIPQGAVPSKLIDILR